MSEVASKYLARYRTISTPRFKMVVECSTLMSLIPSGLFSLFIDCKLALCTTFRLQHIRAFFSGGPPQSLLLVLATGFCIKESLAPDPEIPELRSALVSESFLVLDRNLYLILADFISALIFSTFRRDFSMLGFTLSLPRHAQPAWKKIQTKIAVQDDTKMLWIHEKKIIFG